MPDNDVKVTAVFQKKTVSGDYKLTLDVSRHGDVYENSTRGDDAKSYYWLDDDDELTFKAVADKGYEVRWRIGQGQMELHLEDHRQRARHGLGQRDA